MQSAYILLATLFANSVLAAPTNDPSPRAAAAGGLHPRTLPSEETGWDSDAETTLDYDADEVIRGIKLSLSKFEAAGNTTKAVLREASSTKVDKMLKVATRLEHDKDKFTDTEYLLVDMKTDSIGVVIFDATDEKQQVPMFAANFELEAVKGGKKYSLDQDAIKRFKLDFRRRVFAVRTKIAKPLIVVSLPSFLTKDDFELSLVHQAIVQLAAVPCMFLVYHERVPDEGDPKLLITKIREVYVGKRVLAPPARERLEKRYEQCKQQAATGKP